MIWWSLTLSRLSVVAGVCEALWWLRRCHVQSLCRASNACHIVVCWPWFSILHSVIFLFRCHGSYGCQRCSCGWCSSWGCQGVIHWRGGCDHCGWVHNTACSVPVDFIIEVLVVRGILVVTTRSLECLLILHTVDLLSLSLVANI